MYNWGSAAAQERLATIVGLEVAPSAPAQSDWQYGADRLGLENIRSELTALVHELHFLLGDLERGLDIRRGEPARDDAVSLIFPHDRIDATLWLAGSAWERASKLAAELR